MPQACQLTYNQDFGVTHVGEGTVVHAAKIYNFDTVTHRISNISLPSGWSTDLATSTDILSGSYVEFNITLLDSTAGVKDGSLVVTTYITFGGTPSYYNAIASLVGIVGTIYTENPTTNIGGVTGGGAAKNSYTYKGIGGVKGSGTSATTSYVRGPIWTAGGCTVFGAAHYYDIEGGVEVGGLCENTRDIIPVHMTGGVTASGTSNAYDIEGGVSVSGLADNQELVYVFGGCSVSGTANAYDIEGGVIADGTADVSLTPATLYGIGGIKGSGISASISLDRTNLMSGGVETNYNTAWAPVWLNMNPLLPEEDRYAVVGGEAVNRLNSNQSGSGGVSVGAEFSNTMQINLAVVTSSVIVGREEYYQTYWLVFTEPASDAIITGVTVSGEGKFVIGYAVEGGATLGGEASWLFTMGPPTSGGTELSGESPTTMSMANVASGGLESTRGARLDYTHNFPKIKTGVGRCFNNDSIVKTREAELAASRRGRLRTTLYDIPTVTNAFSLQHAPTWCYTNEKCDAVLPNCVIQHQGPYIPAQNRGFVSTATSIAAES